AARAVHVPRIRRGEAAGAAKIQEDAARPSEVGGTYKYVGVAVIIDVASWSDRSAEMGAGRVGLDGQARRVGEATLGSEKYVNRALFSLPVRESVRAHDDVRETVFVNVPCDRDGTADVVSGNVRLPGPRGAERFGARRTPAKQVDAALLALPIR